MKILTNLDAGLVANQDKEYKYDRHHSPLQDEGHISEISDENHSFENDTDRSSENDSEITDLNEDVYESSLNFSEDDGNDVNESQPIENETNFLHNIGTLESTSQMPSPASDYDFTEDRRCVRLEKLIINCCQVVQSMKAEVCEIKKQTIETQNGTQNLVAICKDLSVEVFTCVEEIKKRNGLFTDVLVPDIKLPIKKTKRYYDIELALGRHKVVDNLVSPSLYKIEHFKISGSMSFDNPINVNMKIHQKNSSLRFEHFMVS